MIDARISVGLPSHPKTKKLIRRVGEGGAWRLVCLFLWAAQTRPDGDLSGMTGEDIELAADWQGEDGAFIGALVEVGFIDGEEGRYEIHDWQEHNPWAAGAEARSEKARWNAMCKHHGRAKAAEMMPDYAARMRAAERSSNDSATSMHAAENSSAPSPSPSPSPSPLPKEKNTPAAPAGALDPEAFEEAWQAYPKREGSNSRPAAVKAWNARIRAGENAADIVAGVKRYAAYCAAKGSVGTSFVKQAAVFFGPNAHWSEPWSVQPAQTSYPASRPAPPGKMWVGGLLADI